ncbi:MAG: L,D-transpeptidase [Candidatus Aminicenantes bacterium]|nr:L,D-transpeptidase [Candidatus Aminicenantes bacterium]
MKPNTFSCAACLLVLLFGNACNTPPVPPEAARAHALEQDLWRAGGSLFAPEEYEKFKAGLKTAEAMIGEEEAKFGWFRDYKEVRAVLGSLVTEGESLLERINEEKAGRERTFTLSAEALAARIGSLIAISQYFNENEDVRKNVTQAEIKLAEARRLVAKEQYDPAAKAAGDGGVFLDRAEEAAVRILDRYLDPGQLEKWRRVADEAVGESRKKSSVVFLVNKVERKLTVYKNGEVRGSFDIGLGKYGLADKLYSGDDATPEGRYHIVKKIPASKYYKALLIDYPNDADLHDFAAARKTGLVPGRAGVGGDIEIHGGGKDSLTRGCVGLDDKDMDKVFEWARVGTTVAIVGAVGVENTILAEIRKFKDRT